MVVGEGLFSLNESSVPILRFLLEQRAAVEKDSYERLFLLVETIQSTCSNFDLFIHYLRKESDFHKGINLKLLELNESPVLGSETLMAFIQILQSYHLTAKSELDSLSNRLRTAPASVPSESSRANIETSVPTPVSAPLSKSSSKPSIEPSIKPIKPPSEAPTTSTNRGWFKSRNRKKKQLSKAPVTTAPEQVLEDVQSSTTINENQKQLVDTEGFSIRPNMNKDDLDSFYSSSDDDDAADQDVSENFQPIKFEIRPLGDETNNSRL